MKRESFAILTVLMLTISCNAPTPKVEHDSGVENRTAIDSIITGNKLLDNEIQKFANQVNKEDKVTLFTIYIARNPQAARVTIIPVRSLQDSTSFAYPTAIHMWNGNNFLLYNGSELLFPVQGSVKNKYERLQQQYSAKPTGLYDAPILQFDVFSANNFKQVVPAENPSEKPAKEMIEFKPPHK